MNTWTLDPSARLPIKCPKCRHQQSELISRLIESPKITCEICGRVIEINGRQLKAILQTFGQ
jgi:ribosomal protein S27E